MDIIDNLIYATYVSPINSPIALFAPPPAPLTVNRIISEYIAPFPPPPLPVLVNNAFTYQVGDKMNYCAYEDTSVIESTILRHWYDIDNQVNYDTLGVAAFGLANGVRLSSFQDSSTYHLINAYLLENTRMLQIFERVIEKYLMDEEFGIAGNNQVFTWFQNAEKLFFKNDTQISTNIRSLIRPNADASRRNAYWRMFGMDLAFGDINSQGNASIPYHKSRSANQEFIVLFEKYLSEIWQSYINARNTAGANTADINIVVDLAVQLREILIARRGNPTTTYANMNLSREEFASVLITSWFTFIISDNTPVVDFLNCQSSTIGERLLKIGAKVGVPAHSKCQSLFEIAGPAASILTTIEIVGVLDNAAVMQVILSSLNPPPAIPPAAQFIRYMTDFLTVINNWEKATGHRIKNPETNIRGTVKIQQNGVSQSNGVKAQPALN